MSSLDAQKLTRKSHKKCKSTTSLGRTRHTIRHHLHWFFSSISKLWGGMALIYSYYIAIYGTTWWLIPLSKWVITPVINGIFVGLIHWNHWGELTHLRAVGSSPPSIWHYIWPRQNSSNIRVQSSEVFFEVNFVGFFNAQQREALGTCHCCQQISGGTLFPPASMAESPGRLGRSCFDAVLIGCCSHLGEMRLAIPIFLCLGV